MLESQKRERGENGRVYYYRDSKLFVYFINEKEIKEARNECIDLGHICEFCGELIIGESLCCVIGAIKYMFLDIFLSGEYSCRNCIDALKLSPFFFQSFFLFVFHWLFLLKEEDQKLIIRIILIFLKKTV